MVRRSVLFTPGDRPEMMRKAPAAGADVVVFDLEDALAPARKAEARGAVRDVVADPAFDPGAEVCVRVNPVGGGAAEDLAALFEADDLALDSVVLPKVAGAADVEALADLLGEYGALPVLALVESARGVLRADEIAAVEATDAVVFGAEDFAADVGATRTRDGREVSYARQRVVTAAAAADVEAIDTLVTDFEDEERLRTEARAGARLGYDGKLAIHPAQVEPINDAFTPDEEEIEWAERVLEAAREADGDERGVFEVDGEMIDAPLIERAERIVERASAAGRR